MESRETVSYSWMEMLVDELERLTSRRSKSQNRDPRSDSDQGSDWGHTTGVTLTKSQNEGNNMKTMSAAATTTANPSTKHHPTPPGHGDGMGFPLLPSNSKKLASMDRDSIDTFLAPIRHALTALDAESMLHLERVKSGGSLLYDGVQVRPIHQDVMPPKKREGSVVRYVHITEIPDQYSIGIFVFPPRAKIPLHDHPGMSVMSRVLYGDLTRLSLDLLHPEEEQMEQDSMNVAERSWFSLLPSFTRQSSSSISESTLPEGSKRAYLNGQDYLKAGDVTALYPFEGNLHEFVAGDNGAAVLDVLLPPYDAEQGRDCTFYHIRLDDDDEQEQDGTSMVLSNRQACWIIPTGQPEDFHCLSGRYKELGEEEGA